MPSLALRCLFIVGLMLLAVAAWAHWPIKALPAGTVADRILIEKAARRLTLYRGTTVVQSYAVSLGLAPVGAKEREGDQRTPEGRYRVTEHKADSSFHRALRVSYPEAGDVARAAQHGYAPGFDIMIHGLPNDWGVIGRMHRFRDWTAGCIALTNAEIEEVFRVVTPDAQIEIRP